MKHPAHEFMIPGVQEDHQEEQVKRSAQEFRINTPPRVKLDYPEGLSPSRRAMDDRESFMTVCEERLMSLYKDLKRDYDRVHGTEKVGDLKKGPRKDWSQPRTRSGAWALEADQSYPTGRWTETSGGAEGGRRTRIRQDTQRNQKWKCLSGLRMSPRPLRPLKKRAPGT